MRVYYSNDGLENSIKPIIKDAQSYLKQAGNVNLTIPSSFYGAYRLRNLSSRINRWNNKLDNILYCLQRTDKRFDDCISDGKRNIQGIVDYRLVHREGINTDSL